MTLEDFTTYTEVDPNSHIGLVGTNHVDFKAYRNEDAYLYKDKGAGHFTDFDHKIDARINSETGNNYPYVWSVTNDVDDIKGLADAHKSFIGIIIGYSSGYKIQIEEYYWDGSTEHDYTSSYFTPTAGTWYYFWIHKAGTAFTLEIYDTAAHRDAHGSTGRLATLSLTLHENTSKRYVFVANTYNDAVGTNTDLDIENLDLQEGGAILKEVADSLSLSDSLLCNKTFAVTDSVGLADALLANKTLQITDVIALLETVLCNKTFTISDSVTLSELIEVITGAIIKYVTDVIGLSDLVSTPQKTIIIQDLINLLDQIIAEGPPAPSGDAWLGPSVPRPTFPVYLLTLIRDYLEALEEQ